MSLVRLWNRFPLRVEVPFPRDEAVTPKSNRGQASKSPAGATRLEGVEQDARPPRKIGSIAQLGRELDVALPLRVVDQFKGGTERDCFLVAGRHRRAEASGVAPWPCLFRSSSHYFG